MFIYSGFADEISLDLDVQIREIKKCNMEYIEVRGVNGKNISKYTKEEAKEIKKILDNGNVKVSAIGSPIGKIEIADDFEKEIESFKNLLEIANIFETKYIRMFSFFMSSADAQSNRDIVLRRWQKYIDVAKGSNVILLHENEKGIYGDTAERCLDLIETLNCDYVKATFDPANFVQCGVDTLKAYELLKNHIEYMHIKDAISKTGEVVPAGMGDGNVKEILQKLKASGWSGFLSLEPHLGNFVGFADLESGTKVTKESSGADKFAIAYNALDKIIREI